MTVANPFEQDLKDIEEKHEPLGSLDKEFQSAIANPDQADEIKQANLRPKGWYVSDPDVYKPIIGDAVDIDEDGTRTGVAGKRNLATLLARVTRVVKGEIYTSVVRIKISHEARAKAVWVDESFSHFHPTKHDSATRMYSEAQGMYKAAHGRNATDLIELAEFIAETPFKVNCMVKDDGSLTPWQLAPVGRARRG